MLSYADQDCCLCLLININICSQVVTGQWEAGPCIYKLYEMVDDKEESRKAMYTLLAASNALADLQVCTKPKLLLRESLYKKCCEDLATGAG